jgi:hypothetical protein
MLSMNMKSSIFTHAPDLLYLAIPIGLPSVQFSYFETDWGVTDEMLCYYNGVLIGQLIEHIASHPHLGVDTQSINMLPKLDRHRNYSWPSVSEYQKTIESLLSTNSFWNLYCEYDCEQNSVMHIENNLAKSLEMLQQVLLYCIGEGGECPSFHASYRGC